VDTKFSGMLNKADKCTAMEDQPCCSALVPNRRVACTKAQERCHIRTLHPTEVDR